MQSRTALALLASAALAACSHEGASDAPAAPKAEVIFQGPLPDVQVEALDGQIVNLRDVTRGKVAIVDMWATWCAPCREISERAAELAKSDTTGELAIVGVDEGEARADVRNFLDAKGPAYPIYVDTLFGLSNAVHADQVPTLLLIDRAGTVRGVVHHLDADTLHVVSALLAEKAAPALTPSPSP